MNRLRFVTIHLCCPSNCSLGVFFLKTLLHNQLLIIPIVQNKSLSGVIRFLCNSLKLEIITLKKKNQSLGMVLSYFIELKIILKGKGSFAREKNHSGHIVAGMGVLLNPYRCLYMIAWWPCKKKTNTATHRYHSRETNITAYS